MYVSTTAAPMPGCSARRQALAAAGHRHGRRAAGRPADGLSREERDGFEIVRLPVPAGPHQRVGARRATHGGRDARV